MLLNLIEEIKSDLEDIESWGGQFVRYSDSKSTLVQRILITGPSGFVGRQVLNCLRMQNVELTVILRSKISMI